MVLCQAGQGAVAKQIGAAVADMRDRDARVIEIGGREGGAHARALVLGAGPLVDLAVGLLHAAGQSLLGRPRVGQLVLEHVDRDPRRDLARLRATHTVGDDEQRRPRQ
jgi:hypothetical protein